MAFRLRTIEADSKFSQEITLDALGQVVPQSTVKAVLLEEGKQTEREHKLNLVVTVLLVIMMNIYTDRALGSVYRKLAQGLRYIWPDHNYELPKDSALSYRRYQLGARPMVRLFKEVCQPLTTPETKGAFLFGLRLMAIDGTYEEVPDTPENEAVFGRHQGGRGQSAFPQVQGVYLVECGSHAIVDAGFWPGRTSERVGGFRVLRSVKPGMLVTWDAGFHDYDMVVAVKQEQGAEVLSCLPAHVKPWRLKTLPDGSYLAYLRPSDYKRRKAGECILVRIIEYTFTDPNLPGYNETHRLLTTLLDPELYPALALVYAYHERWEAELVIDEIDTHQRLLNRPLRSLKPVGVIQELYGLLIAHYAVRALMHQAAVQAKLDPDRLSFVGAVRLIQDAVPEFQQTAPEQLPELYQRLLGDIAQQRLPQRRYRSNPRVVKRKMSKFRVKRPEHMAWPQPATPFREAIALLPAPETVSPFVLSLSNPNIVSFEVALI